MLLSNFMKNPKRECHVYRLLRRDYYVPLRNAVNGRTMQATQSPPAQSDMLVVPFERFESPFGRSRELGIVRPQAQSMGPDMHARRLDRRGRCRGRERHRAAGTRNGWRKGARVGANR
jgi:hypothetical protein